jgi:hypothetical protein
MAAFGLPAIKRKWRKVGGKANGGFEAAEL